MVDCDSIDNARMRMDPSTVNDTRIGSIVANTSCWVFGNFESSGVGSRVNARLETNIALTPICTKYQCSHGYDVQMY